MFGDELMQAIVEFVMLDGELMKFLVRPEQKLPEILRRRIHTPPPFRNRAESNITVKPGSRSCQPLAPEHERVFRRIRVIAAPDPGNREAEPFVQQPRRLVRPANFKCRSRC